MASQIPTIVYLRSRSKKTSKLRITGLCAGNSPVTGEFPTQMAGNVENISIWWRHHALLQAVFYYKNLFNISSSMKWFFMTRPAYSDQAPLWTNSTPLVLSWPRMDQWCGYESAAFLTRTSFTNTFSAHNPKSWIITWIILCRIRIQYSLNFVHVITIELIYLFCLLCILCKIMLYWTML